MVKITSDEYISHCDDYDGLCLGCHEFTSGGVEPDAEKYECEGCGDAAVMGTEMALVCGHIEISD